MTALPASMNPRLLLLACALASLAGSVAAQYKIVAPDGSVTYTDRPPAAEAGKVIALGRSTPAATDTAPAVAGLPFELRQIAARYPVTLYTGTNCLPCDNGRQLLQQRGVPYVERRILTIEDSAALERLSGGRSIPTLTVGVQPLRGFNPVDWASYLDAAGYPRESRLPRGWQAPPATPLVAREAPAASAPAATPAPSPVAAAPTPPSPEPPSPEPPSPEPPSPEPPAGPAIKF